MKIIILSSVLTFLNLQIVLFAQERNPKEIVQWDLNTVKQKLNSSSSIVKGGDLKNFTAATPLSIPYGGGKTMSIIAARQSITTGNNNSLNSFIGISDNNTANIKVSYSKEFFRAVILENGIFTIIANEPTYGDDFFSIEKVQNSSDFTCGTINNEENTKGGRRSISVLSDAGTLKTYDFAVMVTPEYYAEAGGTDALVEASIVTNVMGMSLFYERESAITFNLTAHPSTGKLFFRNLTSGNNYYQNLNYVDTQLDTEFSAGYDIGHCFHYISGGGSGLAQLGAVCGSGKGRGWSGASSIVGSYFYGILFHEVAHQFNAAHTFHGNDGNCSGGNRSASSAYEPGSGSTLMSYGGNCSSQNTNLSSEFYFHVKSLESIVAWKNATTCATNSSNSNVAPIVNAGPDIVIPKNTPFYLNGSASDSNGDSLSYVWEQYDLSSNAGGLGSIVGTLGLAGYNDPNGPLFRSVFPRNKDSRYFPNRSYVINDQNVPPNEAGEALSNVSRDINFKLVVRDNNTNGSGLATDDLKVTVDATKGPFTLTYPNGSQSFTVGQSLTVTWDVNSTDLIAPNVAIELSYDGGYTFPKLVSSGTNDGSQQITIPSNALNSSEARLRIRGVYPVVVTPPSSRQIMTADEGVNSFFYDISDSNFTITNSTCNVVRTVICDADSLEGDQGSSIFNLSMTKFGGEVQNTFITTVNNASPLKQYFWLNPADSSCVANGSFYQKSFTFRPSKSGYYNITSTGGSGMSIFNSTSATCNSFLGSSAISLSGGYYSNNSNISLFLDACQLYTLDIVSFQIPEEVEVFMSGPGDILTAKSVVTSGYNYDYIAVSKSDNRIKAISSSASFASLDAGEYDVYGVHYASAITSSYFLNKLIAQIKIAINSNNLCITFSENSKHLKINCTSYPSISIIPPPSFSFCIGDAFSLGSDINSAYTYQWYKDGVKLSGETSNVLSLTSTGSYSLEATEAGCSAISTPVSITAYPKPSPPTVNSPTIPYNTSAALTANGCAGTVKWYNASSGGTLQLTGSSVNTPNLTATTSYYASCTVSGCTSSTRKQATVTVQPSPCPNTVTLVSPTNNITTGTSIIRSNNNASGSNEGRITATNKITGGNTTYSAGKKVQLNPGFQASGTVVFKAEIGGCSN